MRSVLIFVIYFNDVLSTVGNYAEQYCSQFTGCESCAGRHHDREFTECVWCPIWSSCVSTAVKCRSGYRESVDCPLLSSTPYNETFARVFGTPLIAAAQGTYLQMKRCISNIPGDVQLLKRFAIQTPTGERTDGYVAVDHTSQAIIASFSSVASGDKLFYTHFNAEFFTNRQAQFEGSDGLVNRYLYDSWYKLWYILGMEETLRNLVSIYRNYEIWFIGHSLGGAKAEMSVLSMLFKRLISQKKVRLLTFGATRVGDMSFVNLIEALVPYRFRIVHGRDMVPRYPRIFDGEWTPPHHHRYEVWYPNGMRPGAKYFVCLGAEDPQCSTRLSPWEIRAADNDVYFERSMQHWAESYCADNVYYPRTHASLFANIPEPVYDMSSIRTRQPTLGKIPSTSTRPSITEPPLFTKPTSRETTTYYKTTSSTAYFKTTTYLKTTSSMRDTTLFIRTTTKPLLTTNDVSTTSLADSTITTAATTEEEFSTPSSTTSEYWSTSTVLRAENATIVLDNRDNSTELLMQKVKEDLEKTRALL
ncbi:unnamed protein product [Cylicocyclus nassatus]|uniref:Fungal lipase-type domain-containing protein n=1 Tax=Cylicocyclus nassatus TaxID=53992 RepID=A0AA36MI53_CYLNA|nr:unnamed protein product [Cylicocyclus nassatus]